MAGDQLIHRSYKYLLWALEGKYRTQWLWFIIIFHTKLHFLSLKIQCFDQNRSFQFFHKCYAKWHSLVMWLGLSVMWVYKSHVFPITHLWHTTFSDTAWSLVQVTGRGHMLSLSASPSLRLSFSPRFIPPFLLLPPLSVCIPPLNNALFPSSLRGDSRKHWNRTP